MNLSRLPYYAKSVTLHPVMFAKAVPWFASFRRISNSMEIFHGIFGLGQYGAREYIKKGDVVIDAGANVGMFSIMAASLGATVYAFEPASETFSILRENVKKWPSITPIHMGLGNEHAFKKLNIARNLGGSALEDACKNDAVIGQEETEIATIDDFVKERKLSSVHFIKMDTEGYERQIIRGAANTIERFSPVISCSAYHYPDDPEVIPQIVLGINPRYKAALLHRGELDLELTPSL